MWLTSFLDRLRLRPRSAKSHRRQRRSLVAPLRLEALEDRCLLSFSPAVSYPVGVNPLAVVTADFNNDNRLDLAVVNNAGNSVSVLLGKPDGTFGPAVNAGTGASPVSLAVGDFDGDSVADLIAAENAGLSLLKGNGDGSYQTPVVIPIPPQPIIGHPAAGLQPQYLNSVAIGD